MRQLTLFLFLFTIFSCENEEVTKAKAETNQLIQSLDSSQSELNKDVHRIRIKGQFVLEYMKQGYSTEEAERLADIKYSSMYPDNQRSESENDSNFIRTMKESYMLKGMSESEAILKAIKINDSLKNNN